MLSVTILGTGGGMPIPERFLSSVVLKFMGRNILFDCGEGTQVAIRKFKTGFKVLDVICLTHGHGDHIFGLPGLLSTLANSERTEPVSIIGPTGIKKIINGMTAAVNKLPYSVQIKEVSCDTLPLIMGSERLEIVEDSDLGGKKPDLILSTLPLEHRVACIGYKLYVPRQPEFIPAKARAKNIPLNFWSSLQRGETIVAGEKVYRPDMVLGKERKGLKFSFITDSRPNDEIASFINNSDLLICEGTYASDEDLDKAIERKHMTFREAATLASYGKVKELWLTHYSPSIDKPSIFLENATSVFENTITAYDGLKKILSF